MIEAVPTPARRIVATGGGTRVHGWVDALADGGILVAPVESSNGQSLVVVRKTGGSAHHAAVRPVRYVSDRSPVPVP